MAQRVIIPRLGQTMTEGIVVRWYKQQDEKVAVGDPVYELEYDKAVATVEAKKAGVLKRLVNEGAAVPVGDTIGIILEEGEKLEDIIAQKTFNVVIPDKADSKNKPEVGAKVIVIGGGPGGYVAAIRLGILGAKVILIEKDKVGGTCLNRGCIPTKALLQSAEVYSACLAAEEFGVEAKNVSFDLAKINARKQKIVNTLVKGVQVLLAARKIEIISGIASFESAHTVLVKLMDGSEKKLTADNIIIATGSVPAKPPISGIDGKNVITSKEALDVSSIPKSMIIIGGGVIGMELGSIYSKFGCKITLLEAMPDILPNIDAEVVKNYRRAVKKLMDIHSGALVSKIEDDEDGKRVIYKIEDKEQSAKADVVLVAIGRRPNLEELNLKAAGIMNERGCVTVDNEFKTNVDGIYCVGDANGKTMLAHAASAQAIDVADRITGNTVSAGNRHDIVPSCIYTHPEIGIVGKTEQQLKLEGVGYKVCKFSLRANGRSLVLGKGDGFVKILAGEKHGEVLGVHIIGPFATELIGECALAMRLECCIEDIAGTIHAHPTVGEAIMEAAETGLFGATHSL